MMVEAVNLDLVWPLSASITQCTDGLSATNIVEFAQRKYAGGRSPNDRKSCDYILSERVILLFLYSSFFSFDFSPRSLKFGTGDDKAERRNTFNFIANFRNGSDFFWTVGMSALCSLSSTFMRIF